MEEKDKYLDWLHQKADECDRDMMQIGHKLWECDEWGNQQFEMYKEYKTLKTQRDTFLHCAIQYQMREENK